jgi:hypothetical protein
MPRLRTLKPEFFTHEVLGALPTLARLLFQGLWCHADREGRLEDRPRFLKTVILPYDDCNVDALLAELARCGFIVRYEVDGKRLLAIPTFLKHQKPHTREQASTLPPPPNQGLAPAEPAGITAGTTEAVPSPVPGTTQAVASRVVFGLWSSVFGLGGAAEGPPLPAAAPPPPGPVHLEPSGTPPPPRPAPTPRHPAPATAEGQLLREATEACASEYERLRGERYAHRGAADTAALKRLLALRSARSTPEEHLAEVLRRWGLSLQAEGRHRCDSLAQFSAFWGAFGPSGSAVVGTSAPRPAPDVRRGMVRAEDSRKRMEPPGLVRL